MYDSSSFTTFNEEKEKLESLTEKELNSSVYDFPTIFFDYNRVNETLSEIEEIIDICNKNNI